MPCTRFVWIDFGFQHSDNSTSSLILQLFLILNTPERSGCPLWVPGGQRQDLLLRLRSSDCGIESIARQFGGNSIVLPLSTLFSFSQNMTMKYMTTNGEDETNGRLRRDDSRSGRSRHKTCQVSHRFGIPVNCARRLTDGNNVVILSPAVLSPVVFLERERSPNHIAPLQSILCTRLSLDVYRQSVYPVWLKNQFLSTLPCIRCCLPNSTRRMIPCNVETGY